MQGYSRILLFLISSLFLSTFLFAQQKGFSSYSLKDGLPQSKINTVLEDSRGALWIGTQSGGISRFDGKQFINYNSQDGLINNHILHLFEDKEGILWIGTIAGISLYDGREFKNLQIKGDEKRKIHQIWQDEKSRMWIGTDRGAYLYAEGEWEKVDPENKHRIAEVSSFQKDKNGAIWLGHSRGLLRILGNEIKEYTPKEGLNSRNIRAIDTDPEGNIWIGSFLGGIHRFDGRKFVPQFIETPVHEGFITDIHFDREGNLWVASQDEGMARCNIQKGSLEFYDRKQGLASNHISQVIDDSWGNIWAASLGGGISKFSNRKFIHYGKENGLRSSDIISFEMDAKDRIWLGSAERGFYIMDERWFTHFDAQSGFQNVGVKKIFRDKEDRMWLGTLNRGLALYSDSLIRFFSNKNGFRANIIQDIAQDSKGNLWIASKYNGIYRIRPYTDSTGIQLEIKAFQQEEGLLSNRIEDLHIDNRKRIWYATADKGLGFIEKDSLYGKLPKEILANTHIKVLAEDNKGYLWLGTANQGIYHMYLYDKKFNLKNNRKALSSDDINFILADGNDALWIGTESGLDRVNLDFERNFTEQRHFGRKEGLEDVEINQHAAFLHEGRLWLGANTGFSIYQAQSSPTESSGPRIYLEQLRLFYEPLQSLAAHAHRMGPWGNVQGELQFEPDENNLSFQFNGIDLNSGGTLRYQYRMDKLEKKWSPLQERNDAAYPNLPSGNYSFQVKAVNGDGQESEILEIPIQIATPIYMRPWFILSSIGLLALFIYLIFRIRLNQVRKIARIDQEKLQIEKDLIQLEQKALRLQMNPHFLFNALNSIQGLIAKEDSKKARYYLAKFSKLMRLVLENSRESMIPLEDEIETLEHYLTVEKFSSGEKFEYSIHCDEEIDPEEILIPPMMIQPFIENSIIHGVAHLQEKGRIEVEFRKIHKRIECYITDNGVGRKKAAAIKSQRAHKHKSTALLVTQERLDILSKGADWGKSIEIVDLQDQAGDSAGTRVILRLPLIKDH
ncbi:MAG: two-component regulator propeller domain-containing protein [Bacteroidia bacterium]|nr:two-component regulator propeller domain-containing protein [Bacteroidia bacterium]